MGKPVDETLLEINARANRLAGVGSWRSLYLRFLAELHPGSVLEVGSGDPAFLASLPEGTRRLAVDGNPALAPAYERAGVRFEVADLEGGLPRLVDAPFDAIVCSDVLEHLVRPQRVVDWIADLLAPDGVFFSHVPNEFRLGRTLRVVLGRAESVTFHEGCEEWEDPHVRRFTDRGFRKLLARRFPFSVKLTDLTYSKAARIVAAVGLPVPYGLEGGPTYASTTSPRTHETLVGIRNRLHRRI
jgi:SAM-dependent methyltransferase